jgi:SAM-dependent methyltransferase
MTAMNENQKSTIQAYNESAERFSNTIGKLANYDHTYDFIFSLIQENARVLDLACGPANISAYLLKKKKLAITGFDLSEKMLAIAQENIPDGIFKQQSIIEFRVNELFDLVILGFGLPYLNPTQAASCLRHVYDAIKPGGIFYLSFMDGDKEGFESTSFSPDKQFYLFYHRTESIMKLLEELGFFIIKTWALDYREPNGSITTDSIIVCRKSE